MAYDASFLDEEEKNGQSAPVQSGALNPSSGVITGGTPGQGAQSSGQPTHSGSFTDLNKYLDANSGQNFGTELAGKVQGQVDQANDAQNNASNQFKSQVDQNTVNYDPTTVNSALSDPSSFVKDPNNVSKFNSERDAKYSGPTAFDSSSSLYSPAYQQTQNAAQAANASRTEGGRFSLLDQYFGNGEGKSNYSQGEKNLDNFLVQSDPNAGSAFQKAQTGAASAQQNFNNLIPQLDTYAGQGQATTRSTAHNVRSQLGLDDSGNFQGAQDSNGNYTNSGAIQNLYNGINATAQADNKSAPEAYSQYQSGLSGLNLTPEQAQTLGISNLLGSATYNVDPSQYLGAAPGKASAQNVASSDQYSKMAALAQLAGVQNTFLPDATQAGTYSANPTFDSTGYTEAVSKAKNAALNTPISGQQSQDYGLIQIPEGMSLSQAMNYYQPIYQGSIQADSSQNHQGHAPVSSDPNVRTWQSLQNLLNSYGANKHLT